MLLKINDIYLKYFIYNQYRYNILIGGRGSGKSYSIAQKIILRCLEEKGHRFLIVRKTLPALKRSCWTLVNNLIDKINIPHQKNKTEMYLTINGNLIMFLSLDDPEKIKSIEGVTGIWIEEVSELSEAEFNSLDLILRGYTPNYKQIIMSLNPINELLWLNKRFCFDINLETEFYKCNEKDNRMVLKTTYKDNLYLDEEYKNVLLNLQYQNQNLYRISALGLWGGNKGIIYNNYYIVGSLKESSEVIYGVDFGYNNPTAVIEVRIVDKEYYIKQLIYETGLTNTDLIRQMNALGMNKNNRMYCDSAEPARIEELKRNGFNAWEADKDVNKGIDFVKSQKLFVDENSIDLIKELKTYSWQERKDGSIIDKPGKEFDHLCDSLRYSIFTHSQTVKTVSPLIGVFNFDK